MDCWRKNYNRVNDIDLVVRFGLMGVRMGCTQRVEFLNRPRPGDTTVGSEAYRRDPQKMETFYKF